MAIELDDILDVRAQEDAGRIIAIERVAILTGLTSTDPDSSIAEILSSSVLPAAGSSITVNGDALYLRGRDPEITEGREIARVRLRYEGGGDSSGGTSEELQRGGTVSVQQIQTQKDRDDNQITVTHNGVTQGGEISVFVPQAEPFIETIEQTSNPDALALSWVGYVNSASWRGQVAGSWLVTNASYNEIDTGTNRYKFRWGFQNNADTWLPVVVYIDPETGRPPDGLVADQGIKTVPWYFERDFNSKFS